MRHVCWIGCRHVRGGPQRAAFANETVTGQLIDQSCYKMDKMNTGVDYKMPHGDTKDCAIACAKGGAVALRPRGEGLHGDGRPCGGQERTARGPHESHRVADRRCHDRAGWHDEDCCDQPEDD